jgi:cytochrome c oxidase accessory protein FixG
VERWIDGDAVARRRLSAAPMSASKLARRILKHASFVVLAAVIAHLFLAYYVSLPALWEMIRAAPTRNWGAFVFIAVSTAIVFDFAWFREQLCIVICPYGRLQSALTDDHTLVIGYDAKRGEPRGKAGTQGAGDCVACDRCVHVCPTGIDIRHGQQMECIGCAACIDACDDVMARLARPKGLVRYDSFAGLAEGRAKRWIRPRTILYGILLLAGATVAGWSIGGLRPAFIGVTRMVGAPYYVDSGVVRNQFLIRLVNKRTDPVDLSVRVTGLPEGAAVQGLGASIVVPGLGEEVRPLIVQVPGASYHAPIPFEVEAADAGRSFVLTRSLEFLGPEDAAPAAGGPR